MVQGTTLALTEVLEAYSRGGQWGNDRSLAPLILGMLDEKNKGREKKIYLEKGHQSILILRVSINLRVLESPSFKENFPHALTVRITKKFQQTNTCEHDPLLHVAGHRSGSNSIRVPHKLQ